MVAPIRKGDGTGLAATGFAEVRKGDGTKFTSAIPDSAISQYDATQIAASDGDSVSTWADEQNTGDLSAVGAPTYRSSGINGNASVEFDGVDDEMTASIGTYTQPITYAIVYEMFNLGTNDNILDRQSGSLQYRIDDSDDYNHYDGTAGLTGGSPSTSPEIGLLFWDGSNSEQYVNGSQVPLTDNGVGSTDLVDLQVGNNAFNQYFNGYVGEIVVYNDRLTSSERSDEESRLSDKWGITI